MQSREVGECPCSRAASNRQRRQAIAPLIFMVLASATLGRLLTLAATFRAVYAAARVPMPLLVGIAGRYPWVLLASVVGAEAIVALAAWRSRRPGLWLTVEAFAMAAVLYLFIPILQANLYRPILEVVSSLGQ